MIKRLAIISGGDTGADRAGLDWAIQHGMRHGGWCPKGRKAMDAPLDPKYLLKETPSEDDLERTEWNVRDADATAVFTLAEKATGESARSLTFARKYKKPFLHLHSGIFGRSEKLVAFVEKHNVRRLNIAGSRESSEPGIYEWTLTVLEKMLEE